jgi:hypothetical protein
MSRSVNKMLSAVMAAWLMQFLCNTTSAHADTVGLHLMSVHSNYHLPRNDVNLGVYVVKKIGDETYAVGVYKNTENRCSGYVVRVFNVATYLTLSAGAVTGYQYMRLAPLLTMSTQVPLSKESRLRLHLAPKAPFAPNSATAIHASVEFDF